MEEEKFGGVDEESRFSRFCLSMAIQFHGRGVAAASQAADRAAAGAPSCNPEGEADGSDAVGGFSGRTEGS